MLSLLKQYIASQQFNPGLAGLFVNPFYFARKGLFDNISALAKQVEGEVLDVGCGQKPYESLFQAARYVGLELDTPENRQNKKADYFYDGSKFPFSDDEFDCVVLNEVFEHIFNPGEFLSEIYRVLKADGRLLLTVPFVWDEHEQPCDYARYSSFGIRAVLQNNGFTIVEQRKSMNDIRVIFQMLNDYIYKKTVTKNGYVNLISTLLLMAPFNLLGELLSKLLPKNDDLYLDNIVLAKKAANV